jgi:VanZ family protein
MRRLPLLLGGALLAWGVFRSVPPPNPFPGADKVGHFLGFFAVALAARIALPRAAGAWLWGLLLVAGPVLEYLQHTVSPLRERSLGDALANVAGVLLALALSAGWRRWRRVSASAKAADGGGGG